MIVYSDSAAAANQQKELENGDLKKMMEEAEQSPEFKMLMEALTKLEPGKRNGTVTLPVCRRRDCNTGVSCES